MSAIASFILIPNTAVEGLRDATIPRKNLLGAPHDFYQEYLRENGRNVAEYRWSGYVLATLLCYLRDRCGIDLMHSAHDELSNFLSKTRTATHFIFTDTHKTAYLEKLDAQFSEDALRDYYNEFNAMNEDQAGKLMLDGIKSFHQSLAALDDKSVVVFIIG